MQKNNDLRNKNSMCWCVCDDVCDDFLDSYKAINHFFFSQKIHLKNMALQQLEGFTFLSAWQVKLPSRICSNPAMDPKDIRMQILLLLLLTPILWDIRIWYFVEVFAVTSNREYFLSGSIPFLCENSQDNDESLLPRTEKIPQGPMLLPLFSMWEKNYMFRDETQFAIYSPEKSLLFLCQTASFGSEAVLELVEYERMA